METKIHLYKHMKIAEDQVREAIGKVENVRAGWRVKHPYLSKVLEQAIDWYESDNLCNYTFFHHAVGSTDQRSPAEFYGGLYSFLVNTCLDDSSFAVVWTKYDSENGGYIEGEPWKDDPHVVWANDDSPGRSVNAEDMWKAMEFLIKKEEERDARFEEWENWKSELKTK